MPNETGGRVRLWGRRVRSVVFRALTALWRMRWFELSVVLAGLGVADIWIHVPDWVAWLLAVLSLVLLWLEFRAGRNAGDEIKFGERFDSYEAVGAAVAGNPRYEVLAFPTGTFLVDRELTDWIGHGGRGRLASEPYSLPVELGEVGRKYCRERIKWRLDAFNGPVVGLDTNVADSPVAADILTFRPGKYFDHLSSDLFATVDVTVRQRTAPWFGKPLYIDRHGVPRDFGDSWLLNAVGVNILAITADGRVVAVHQTHRNESSKNLLAPTGSGSLEPQDFSSVTSQLVTDIAAAGAVREMNDEAGIGWNDIADVRFLGFGRWLDKGAKPELLLVARLRIDEHEVRRRKPQRLDKPFSQFAEPLRLRPRGEWAPDDLSSILYGDVAARLSLPLRASLHLMAEAVQREGNQLGDLLRVLEFS